jgi:hypothetical protein
MTIKKKKNNLLIKNMSVDMYGKTKKTPINKEKLIKEAKELRREDLERSGEIVPEKRYLTRGEKRINEINLQDSHEAYSSEKSDNEKKEINKGPQMSIK